MVYTKVLENLIFEWNDYDCLLMSLFLAFNSRNLEIVNTAIIDGQVVELPDSGANPCKGAFIPGCPMVKGRMYIFNRYFTVQQYFIPVRF